jgi:colanic acid/amylovoran biosynthesis protein
MDDKRRSTKILISNIVTLNPGDAAILQGMFQILREKYGENSEIIVFDRLADAAARYYPWASFRQSFFGNRPEGKLASKLKKLGYGHWNTRLRYWWLRACVTLMHFGLSFIPKLLLNRDDFSSLRDYLGADVILSSGGTYLIENYNLWPAIYDYRLTLATKRPLVFFTQSLGPFRQPKYRSAFADVFNRSHRVCVRDEKSRRHVTELGVAEEKVVVAKDAAFVLEPKDRPKSQELSSSLDRGITVAVSVRSLHLFDKEGAELEANYINSVIAMVELAVRQFDAKVTFLSTCQGIEEYWTNDADFAQQVIERLPSGVRQNVELDGAFRQPQEVVETYREFDLVIATRMHAAILGLVAGTPVLGIAYEFKLEELFHQLDIDNARLSTQTMNPERSREMVSSILSNLEDWRAKVSEVRQQCRAQAGSVKDKLPNV